jgi:hypothetical protein
MKKQVIREFLICLEIVSGIALITLLILLLSGKFTLINLLNLYFLEGSIFIVTSAVLSFVPHVKDIRMANFLANFYYIRAFLSPIKPGYSLPFSFALFIMGILFYLLMFAIHFLFVR